MIGSKDSRQVCEVTGKLGTARSIYNLNIREALQLEACLGCIARPWLTKSNKYQEVFLDGGYQQPAHLLAVMSPSEDFEMRLKIQNQIKRITKTEKPNISKL